MVPVGVYGEPLLHRAHGYVASRLPCHIKRPGCLFQCSRGGLPALRLQHGNDEWSTSTHYLQWHVVDRGMGFGTVHGNWATIRACLGVGACTTMPYNHQIQGNHVSDHTDPPVTASLTPQSVSEHCDWTVRCAMERTSCCKEGQTIWRRGMACTGQKSAKEIAGGIGNRGRRHGVSRT